MMRAIQIGITVRNYDVEILFARHQSDPVLPSTSYSVHF